MPNMRICSDSSTFIPSVQQSDSAAVRVLDLVSTDLELFIPRLVAQEVTRNLRTTEQVQRFYQLFHQRSFAIIVDELVPRDLVSKYVGFGLTRKSRCLHWVVCGMEAGALSHVGKSSLPPGITHNSVRSD